MNMLTRIAMALLSVKCNAVETDKGTLKYEHEGELKVGDEVFVEKSEGEEINIVPAEDGEYKAGEITIVVSEGKVAEIREPEASEEAPTEEAQMANEDAPAEEPAEDVDKPAEEEKGAEERIAILEEAVQALREALEAKASAEAELAERVSAVEAKISDLEKPAGEPAERVDEPVQNGIQASSVRMSAWREMNKR